MLDPLADVAPRTEPLDVVGFVGLGLCLLVVVALAVVILIRRSRR